MIEHLLTFKEVANITGLHVSSLYRKSHDPEDIFPTYYTYGTRYARYKKSEIEHWLNQLEPA